MFRSYRVGSVFGVPIKLDITFVLIVPLFAWVIGTQIEPLVGLLEAIVPVSIDAESLSGGGRQWVLGLGGALGLFLSVGVHELGHAVVAMRYGYDIDAITLWIFGGLAQLTELPRQWRHEFLIAVAGPIVSLGMAAVTLTPLLGVSEPAAVVFMLAYLGVMNAALAGFNMLPAFPLDGGRVLRSLLARSRSLPRATKLAAETGKVLAVVLGLVGLFLVNLVLIGIAVFIYLAAAGETRRVMLEATLGDVGVAEVMTPLSELAVIEPRTTVATLLDRMAEEQRTSYPVTRRGRPVGVVTLSAAQGVDAVEREALEARDVMETNLRTVTPDRDAFEALSAMQSHGIDRLLVTDDGGNFLGLVTQADLVRASKLRQASTDWDRSGAGRVDPP